MHPISGTAVTQPSHFVADPDGARYESDDLQRHTPDEATAASALHPAPRARRIVVGMDRPEAVEAYAREFGPDTLMDPKGALRIGAVPHFLASDGAGRILKDVGGVPDLPGPWPPELLDQLAARLGVGD